LSRIINHVIIVLMYRILFWIAVYNCTPFQNISLSNNITCDPSDISLSPILGS